MSTGGGIVASGDGVDYNGLHTRDISTCVALPAITKK